MPERYAKEPTKSLSRPQYEPRVTPWRQGSSVGRRPRKPRNSQRQTPVDLRAPAVLPPRDPCSFGACACVAKSPETSTPPTTPPRPNAARGLGALQRLYTAPRPPTRPPPP